MAGLIKHSCVFFCNCSKTNFTANSLDILLFIFEPKYLELQPLFRKITLDQDLVNSFYYVDCGLDVTRSLKNNDI